MKYIIRIVVFSLVLFTAGCCAKQTAPITDTPLRLTTEEVLQAEDGDRIIVYYPQGVERPVVFKSVETGGWVSSAKVVDD